MYHPGNEYMLADNLQTYIMPSNMILELDVQDRNKNHKDI